MANDEDGSWPPPALTPEERQARADAERERMILLLQDAQDELNDWGDEAIGAGLLFLLGSVYGGPVVNTLFHDPHTRRLSPEFARELHARFEDESEEQDQPSERLREFGYAIYLLVQAAGRTTPSKAREVIALLQHNQSSNEALAGYVNELSFWAEFYAAQMEKPEAVTYAPAFGTNLARHARIGLALLDLRFGALDLNAIEIALNQLNHTNGERVGLYRTAAELANKCRAFDINEDIDKAIASIKTACKLARKKPASAKLHRTFDAVEDLALLKRAELEDKGKDTREIDSTLDAFRAARVKSGDG